MFGRCHSARELRVTVGDGQENRLQSSAFGMVKETCKLIFSIITLIPYNVHVSYHVYCIYITVKIIISYRFKS